SPELAAEVASFRDVVAELAQLAPSTPMPSPTVRERLLSRVHLEERGASIGGVTAPAPAAVPTPASRRWPTRFGPFAAAASILVLVGLGAETLMLLRRERELEASGASVAAK